MSAETQKPKLETRRESLGRNATILSLVGLAAITVTKATAFLPYVVYTGIGGLVLNLWGAHSRKHPERKFYKRRVLSSAGGHH